MIFEIERKLKVNPIKTVKFKSDLGSECELRVTASYVQLEITDGGSRVSVKHKNAIELGEMLIKLGKQDLEDNTNERL